MRESAIERKVCGRIALDWKGKTYKLNGQGDRGKPDRLVLLPGGVAFFIEFKAPGKKLRKLQEVECERLNELGFVTLVIDDYEDGMRQVEELLST